MGSMNAVERFQIEEKVWRCIDALTHEQDHKENNLIAQQLLREMGKFETELERIQAIQGWVAKLSLTIARHKTEMETCTHPAACLAEMQRVVRSLATIRMTLLTIQKTLADRGNE